MDLSLVSENPRQDGWPGNQQPDQEGDEATDAIFRANAADAGKVSLDKISWFVPHVLPADAEKFLLYKIIESKVSLSVAYKTRQSDTIKVPAFVAPWCKTCTGKTEWIIAGIQMEKGDQTENPALFDHVNLKNMYVMLNATRYPAVGYNLSFANQQYSRACGDAYIHTYIFI